MQLIHSTIEMQALMAQTPPGEPRGFVPTMGYLHEGHLSLVKRCKQDCAQSVVSIFVNPTQFGPNEDFASYPRDPDRDLKALEKEGVDIVFNPSVGEIYPAGHRTWVDVSRLSEVLCGASRPGHFRGVATVVLKLVNIVQPNLMFMGIKDFQQVVILERMLGDLNTKTRIVRCPIVREADGLAMSSRNSYLDDIERGRAICLSHAIREAKYMFSRGERNCRKLEEVALEQIRSCEGKVDYLHCVDPRSLEVTDIAEPDTRLVMAVFIGKTRLIDNDALGA
jgi:pantoate--beta-alanine ligase